MKLTAITVGAFFSLRRGLDGNGVVIDPTKTVALQPKGNAPTVREISLLVDAHIVDKGGATVDDIPIITDEYVPE